MTKQEQYALEGNFKSGYPDLYNTVSKSIKELQEKYKELQKMVKDDFPMETLWEDPDSAQWDYVSCWVKLTEDEMREFKDYVHWSLIREYQTFGEDFKREFGDRMK